MMNFFNAYKNLHSEAAYIRVPNNKKSLNHKLLGFLEVILSKSEMTQGK